MVLESVFLGIREISPRHRFIFYPDLPQRQEQPVLAAILQYYVCTRRKQGR